MFGLVLAGGGGERLWPESRRARPKPLLSIAGVGASLLIETVERVAPVCGDGLAVVCRRSHALHIRRELARLPEPRPEVWEEPEAKGTGPACILGALLAGRRFGSDVVTGIFPSDHLVTDALAFRSAMGRAEDAARDGWLALAGVEALYPGTDFGYIRAEPATDRNGLSKVVEFVEKPDAARASEFAADPTALWNSGIFCWRADAFLGEADRLLPACLHAVSARLEAAGGTIPDGLYDGIATFPIDTGVLERSTRCRVQRLDCGWSDIGSYGTLARLLAADGGRPGDLLLDSGGSLVRGGGGRPVVIRGLKNVVVIEEPDLVVVADLALSERWRELVGAVRERYGDRFD